MGNGLLMFQLGQTYNKPYTDPRKPWEDTQKVKDLIAHDSATYTYFEIVDSSVLPNVSYDAGKSTLNALRESYNSALISLRLEPHIFWKWGFTEETCYLNTEDCDKLSLTWDDIWKKALSECNDRWPINDYETRDFLRDAKNVLDLAVVNHQWVRISYYNGY